MVKLICDHSNLIDIPTLEPLFVNQNTSGLMIEGARYENDRLILSGWAFGEVKFSGEFVLNKINRKDVQDAFSIEEFDTGFEIAIDKIDMEDFSIKVCESIHNLYFPSESKIEPIDFLNFSKSRDLLIIGGAPTVEENVDYIKSFEGEIWALNDSIFFLENNEIYPDKLIFTDKRFIRKNIVNLGKIKCTDFFCNDLSIDMSLKYLGKNIQYFQIAGRDGFCTSGVRLFHGCSVFNAALQLAYRGRYSSVTSVGVLLNSPKSYSRIDGTRSMPEYVHKSQVYNLTQCKKMLTSIGCKVKGLEFNSTINFV
ncbi:motility associated factor glycosyltransferase family protein [Vibrio porteresiae]|uniref:Uncharacterized protein n=1 Tax=Vibrio porteresiae DSM 19223 TaxID=1123496 RepID=A0ABZ0QDL2_9VIBR|nr:hypothetical protein [Vibrio porteresiae]WPC74282.1 hypothetical protein R8Z52_03185 [Vibrio porteresiae DSM 19223]